MRWHKQPIHYVLFKTSKPNKNGEIKLSDWFSSLRALSKHLYVFHETTRKVMAKRSFCVSFCAELTAAVLLHQCSLVYLHSASVM